MISGEADISDVDADCSAHSSIAVLGGSSEQREVLHELYVRVLLACGYVEQARAHNIAARLPIPISIPPAL